MSETSTPEMTAEELRAIARELSAYVELHPDERARSAMRDTIEGSPASDTTWLRRH